MIYRSLSNEQARSSNFHHVTTDVRLMGL